MVEIFPDGWRELTEGQNVANTIDELLDEIVPYVKKVSGATDVSILRPRKMRFKRSDGLELKTNGYQLIDVLISEASSSEGNEIVGQRIPFGYGITGLAAEQGITQIVDDISSDPCYIPGHGRAEQGAEIAIPIYFRKAGPELLGVLEAQAAAPFSKEATDNLELLGSFLGSKLYGIAKNEHDGLTGLLNKNAFMKYYACLEIQYALRNDYNLTFAFLDLDNFKVIDDTLGHLEGDRYITRFADELKRHARQSDILCHVGGDEFLIMMPETDRDEARKTMIRLVTEIGDNIRYEDPRLLEKLGHKYPVPIGISYGIGSLFYAEKLHCIETDGASIPHDSTSFEKLYHLIYKEADEGAARMKLVTKAGR